jgi:hypothetical protein
MNSNNDNDVNDNTLMMIYAMERHEQMYQHTDSTHRLLPQRRNQQISNYERRSEANVLVQDDHCATGCRHDRQNAERTQHRAGAVSTKTQVGSQ